MKTTPFILSSKGTKKQAYIRYSLSTSLFLHQPFGSNTLEWPKFEDMRETIYACPVIFTSFFLCHIYQEIGFYLST